MALPRCRFFPFDNARLRTQVVTVSRWTRIPKVGLLLVAMTSLAACGEEGQAAQGNSAGSGGRGGPGGPGGAGGRPAVVETAAVSVGDIAREVTVTGTVAPIRVVTVNSQASGALLSVLAEEGTPVRAGQVLARVDAGETGAQLRNAEAQFTVAQAALQRAEQLRERQVITLPEYERDRSAFDAARAQLDALRTRAGYAVVRAPVAGVVTLKSVEAGDVVAPQTRLFEIADLSTLVVPVQVSELDVVRLGEGDPARVTLDAYPGQSFPGRIRRIFPAADPATRLVPVEVALSGEAARAVRPGFLARVSLALGTSSGVRLVPAGAVVGAAGSQAVYVVKDGVVERRPVQTGLNSQGQVEITEGLEPGEAVVVVGNNQLRDGAEVRVTAGPGGGAPRGEAKQGAPAAGGAR